MMMSFSHKDEKGKKTHFLDGHLHVEASRRNFGVFKCLDTGHTARNVRNESGEFARGTHYARRLWISVIAGTLRAFENGFHLFTKSHQPEIVSPKFRGEVSSIFHK